MIDENEEYLHVKPRTCLSINITVLRIMGVWFPEEKQRTWRSRLYILHAIFAQGGLFYMYFLSEIIEMLSSFGNIEKMTDASFLLLTHFSQAIKNFYFYKYSQKILAMLDKLEMDVFVPKNGKQRERLNWAMKRARNDSVILLVMGFATCSLWGIFPFIEKTDGTIRLPLSGWYPFDSNKTPFFQIVFCYQIIGVTCNAMSNISMDTTATGMIVQVCAQIDILRNALQNMKQTAIDSLLKRKLQARQTTTWVNVAKDRLANADEEHTEYTHEELEAEMIKTFRQCVIHHEEIIDYAIDIEEIFNICFLGHFFAAMIIICLTMFKMSLVESLASIEFLSMLLYQACIIFELLLYCWHGNEMMLKSIALSDAVYESEWYEFSPKFSRGIIILMVRASRPIYATAGKFFQLSLATYTGILRCSWSYFAVLNSMHEEKED